MKNHKPRPQTLLDTARWHVSKDAKFAWDNVNRRRERRQNAINRAKTRSAQKNAGKTAKNA